MDVVPVPVFAKSVTFPLVTLENVTALPLAGPDVHPVSVPAVDAIFAPVASPPDPAAILLNAAATSTAVAPLPPAVTVTPPRMTVWPAVKAEKVTFAVSGEVESTLGAIVMGPSGPDAVPVAML